MPPQPLPTGATKKTQLSTMLTTEPLTPHQDRLNRQEVPEQRHAPGVGGRHHAPCNHENTPHHRHRNDSLGRNINQLHLHHSANLNASDPHPKRGHNPPTSYAATTPSHNHQPPTSRTRQPYQHTAKPAQPFSQRQQPQPASP
ncbi:hypothetical protein ATANTOWER_000228 [Ataeniobius toweri]|uniref:Uncharacterized protein n=1 Tax=Ataeniobius toweri TaxID=208326 RepID=A0ABU7BLR4_9TELE|nr:hypothetical protein [Ataeniobius toweri]